MERCNRFFFLSLATATMFPFPRIFFFLLQLGLIRIPGATGDDGSPLRRNSHSAPAAQLGFPLGRGGAQEAVISVVSDHRKKGVIIEALPIFIHAIRS